MLTLWSVHTQAELYVPGVLRRTRVVQGVPSVIGVSSVRQESNRQEIQSKGRVSASPPATNRSLAEAYREVSSLEEAKPHGQVILAKEVMSSPVVSISITAPVAEAWKLFHQRRFRHVPVVTEAQQIVGILSDRDVWREAAGIHKQPMAEGLSLSDLTVQDIMTAPVLTAHPDTEIRTIARVMFEERIGAMPIVHEAGNPVGIVTRSDILRTVMKNVPFELYI